MRTLLWHLGHAEVQPVYETREPVPWSWTRGRDEKWILRGPKETLDRVATKTIRGDRRKGDATAYRVPVRKKYGEVVEVWVWRPTKPFDRDGVGVSRRRHRRLARLRGRGQRAALPALLGRREA